MIEQEKVGKKRHVFFWVMLPVLVLIAGLPFYTAHAWNFRNIAGAVILGVFCSMLALMIYDTEKFNWAARGMAAMLFLICAGYLGGETYKGIQAKTFYPDGTRSSTSVPNAIKAFAVFGLPSLLYTIFGNKLLNWRKKQ